MSQVARGTLWNIAGTAVPAVAAVAAIPLLLRGLGAERFGLLTIAWASVNYLLVFNLGLGRASVWRLVQERDNEPAWSEIAWTSLAAHFVLGAAGWLVLVIAARPLAVVWLRLSPDLEQEAVRTFQVLGATVPVLLLTLALRAMLEARQRFDLVNLVQIPAAAFNYVGPLCVMPWTRRLDLIVLALLAGRAVTLSVHTVQVWRVLPAVRRVRLPTWRSVGSLLGPGVWLTVLTATLPLLTVVDRLAIGRLVSVEAVAWYAVPYEIVSRCWIFSASLLRALFPRLTELGERKVELVALHRRALRLVVGAVVPLAFALSIAGDDLLRLWLGAKTATEGARVLQWLAIGLVASSAAAVPSTVLSTAGRASWAGTLNVIEWVAYVGLCFVLTARWGIAGTAVAWAVRATADLVLMLAIGGRFLGAAMSTISIPVAYWLVIAAVLLASLPFAALQPPWAGPLLGLVAVVGLGGWFWMRVIEPPDRLLLARFIGRVG